MSREALASCSSPPPHPRHCNISSQSPTRKKNCDSALWNAMVAPLRGLAVKGFLWYQGEANTHSNKRDHYACTFPALVASWRQEFSLNGPTSSAAPFGFVQLAPYREGVNVSGFPVLRWHQTADTGAVPNPSLPGVFMAVSIDTNDQDPHPSYTVVGLHPRYKQVVAERLAVAGLRVAYGDLTCPTGGPMPLNVTRQNNGQVTVQYDQEVVYIGSGGFSVCMRPAHLCDRSLSLKNWQSVPPDRVVQESSRMLSIRLAHSRPLVLAYLWAETPVREYLKAPIYSLPPFNLPAPPWKKPLPPGSQLAPPT